MIDQGNVYTNSGNAAAQSLFIQQATQGLGGNFSQGMGSGNGAANSNGLVHLDPAATLHSLINQQLSMFNNPMGDFASTMGNLGAPLVAPMPSAGMVQPQGSHQQG